MPPLPVCRGEQDSGYSLPLALDVFEAGLAGILASLI